MGWEATLITSILLLLAAFMTGAPLFVAFLAINLIGVAIYLGQAGFGMVANSIFDTANYSDLATIPLFVLMAEILFRSGSVNILFDAVDKLVGRMKGRQYVLTISLSTVFGALSGSGMAVAANSQDDVMNNASSADEVNGAYKRQVGFAVTSYSMMGVSAGALVLHVAL